MAEPTKIPTAALATDTEILQERFHMDIGVDSTILSAWQAWATTTDATAYANYINNYDGRFMRATIKNSWLAGWPAPDNATGWTEYVTKWSGACVEDVSSGMGGLCWLETNDVNFVDNADVNATGAAIFLDVSTGEAVYAQGQGTNEAMLNFRLQASDFTTFDGAWATHQTTDGSFSDGRAFYKSIESLLVDSAVATNLEAFDYASCTVTAKVWQCYLWLPTATAQTAGYPSF